MMFDTDDIKTENDFAGLFYVLVKVGENLVRQGYNESLLGLVLALGVIKRNHIESRHRGGQNAV